MSGLQRLLKVYGSMIVKGNDGKNAVWLWDYANDQPKLKSEMSKEEILASERAKWTVIKKQIKD